MGSNSPVSRIFHIAVPGFSLLRYTGYCSNIAILFLIALSLRIFYRFQLARKNNPLISFRYTSMMIVTIIVVVSTNGIWLKSVPNEPVVINAFDVISTCISVLIVVGLGIWYLTGKRRKIVLEESRARIFEVLSLLALIIAVSLIAFMFAPRALLTPVTLLLTNIESAANSVQQAGLSGISDVLDRKNIPVPAMWMLILDVFLLCAITVPFLFWILRDRNKTHSSYWVMLMFVLFDMLLAVPRYEQGNIYLVRGQIGRDLIIRPITIQYEKNERNPEYTYVSIDTWKPIRGYMNYAQQYRIPTFLSAGPFFDKQTIEFMKTPEAIKIFSKLLWIVNEPDNATIQTWEKCAVEPRIQSEKLTPNRFETTLNVQVNTRLVWTDSWALGWRVYLNGKRVELKKIFGLLKSVDIPVGSSTVVFVYTPPYLIIGLATFLAGSVWIIVLIILIKREKRNIPAISIDS
jgi:hypothetical protein